VSGNDRGDAPARRVVVTGLGAVTPVGNDIRTIWDALVHGKSGIARVSRFDPSPYDSQIAGEVRDLDISQYMDRKEIRRTDRFTHYAVAAATQALRDAKLDKVTDGERVGTAISSGLGGIATMADQIMVMEQRGPSRLSPFFVPMIMANAASAQISMQFGLKGPSLTHISACASSSHAIGEGGDIIRRGQADVMVVGGSEACVIPVITAAFASMKTLTTRRNDTPEAASRPFDRDRDGFVLSEGAAVLVLEEREHARARGARSYGELVGYGATADAYHITAPSPEGEGNARAMRMALEEAGLRPDEIDYINAHGTSTQPNDREETAAIKQVFGEHAYTLLVSSTKSMTGHLLGAAGAIEAIACLLAIRDGCIPPTINLEHPDEGLDLDYVPNTARARAITTALSNSMGFGGHNASLILRADDAA
jgi:3-oxoacyl-[acyl-carrier-protein] synthase II